MRPSWKRPWVIGQSEQVHRRPAVLVAAVVTGALALPIALTGVPGSAPTASASPKSAAAPTWTTYFYPLKVGLTCQEELTTGATGTETLTVTAVTKTKQGQAVTIDEGSSTEVNGTSVPTNAAIHYVITKSGQLISAPSAGQLGGQAYRVEGNTVFPAVQTLLSGGSGLSRERISAPLADTDLAQIKSILTTHATSLSMALVLKQSGTKVALLQTPAGTYHDVLAVRSTLRSLDITNALASARRDLDREIEPIVAKSVVSTVWYAPGKGPVKVVASGVTGIVTGCSPGPSASTTTPST
jgi:hypothetical protein